GRITESNSSFADESGSAQPVGRWKEKLSREQVVSIESAVGDTLKEFGYELTTSLSDRGGSFRGLWLRLFYSAFLDAKLVLNTRTALGRFANVEPLHVDTAE